MRMNERRRQIVLYEIGAFVLFWALSIVSQVTGPFHRTSLAPAILFGFGEAILILIGLNLVVIWMVRRRRQSMPR
jgi:hypothetical protein